MLNQCKTGNFIQKLENLLTSQTFSDIISWDSSKTSIDVLDIKRMETQIIPRYFRHQKFESFVRQLNLYGFRKIKFQGRQRFTHPLLVGGQQLTAVAQSKCSRNSKVSKQTAQSGIQLQNRHQEPQMSPVLLNSMENASQLQNLNQQEDIFMQIQPTTVSMLPRQAVYMVPASFFNTWNCMGDNNFWNYMEAVQRPIVPIMQSIAIVPHFQ